MAKYHQYIFDSDKRTVVARFEEMYKQENISNFDSWNQEDLRKLNRKIVLSILNDWNFQTIVDIGTGKGALTHMLKKRNNLVYGLDISETAINAAQTKYPDIRFDIMDVNEVTNLDQYISNVNKEGEVDLVFSSECLSYVENWRKLIEVIANRSKYLMISLYLPNNPIGFVKNLEILEQEVGNHFEIIELIQSKKSQFIVLFAINNKYCAV